MKRQLFSFAVTALLAGMFSSTPAHADTMPGNRLGTEMIPGTASQYMVGRGGGLIGLGGPPWNRESNYIASPDGQLQFFVQSDCNLVVYWHNLANWAIEGGPAPYGYAVACWLEMQYNGDLVFRTMDALGNVYIPWHSNTGGNGGSTLQMQNDGNLVVYTPGHRDTWSLLAGGFHLLRR
jgi:hypothetical protein